VVHVLSGAERQLKEPHLPDHGKPGLEMQEARINNRDGLVTALAGELR